jgi:hypothetical protein
MGRAAMPKNLEANIAAGLSVRERVLLFCLGSHTDWVEADVPHATTQVILIKGLVDRNHRGASC